MTADNKREIDQQLDDILGRVEYIGTEPMMSEDELMEMVLDEIRTRRADRRQAQASTKP